MIGAGVHLTPQLKNLICFQVLLMLCTPFTQFPAFKEGIIDEKGKYLISSNKRTKKQKDSITYLDKLIINVKKMINKLPGGENKLKNIVSAMILIKQSYQQNVCPQGILFQRLEDIVDQFNTGEQRYQQMIGMWLDYINNKNYSQQVGVAAIGGSSGVSGEPTNNTSGVSFNSLPLGMIIRRSKGKANDQHNNQFIINTEK